MSAPELRRSGGGDDDSFMPILQQAELATTQRQVVQVLDERIVHDAHGFAQGHLPGLITLPDLADCSVAVYRRVSEGGDTETGGGLQFAFIDALGGAIGVRVLAYSLGDSAVRAEDPFDIDQAETVARAVSLASAIIDLENLVVRPDLTSCVGESEALIVQAGRTV